MLLVIIAATILVGLVIYKYVLRPPNFPDGPPRVPLLGSVPFLLAQGTTSLGRFLLQMPKRYGPTFSFYLGPQPIVLVSDAKLIREIYKMPEVSGRVPNRPFDDVRALQGDGSVTGILFSNGTIWTEQRRSALRSLRDMGFGKASMDEIISDEMIRLCHRFAKTLNEPIRLDKKMNLSIVSALWTILTSETMDLDDSKSLKTIEHIDETLSREGSGVPSLFSMLLPDVFKHTKRMANFSQAMESIFEIFRPHIEEHANTLDVDNPRDFLDMYLIEMAQAQSGSSFHGAVGSKSLEVTLADLFLAGTETTSTTLLWAFLYLLHYPKVQEKVQEEIDSVVGQVRTVKQEDKDLLPYTHAVILEIQRFASLVPIGNHNTTSEVKFGQYTIPKNVAVMANIAYVHYDPAYWTKPNEFNPERFINSNGKVILNHVNFMPFSTGRRFCMGQSLAEKELFLFLAGILQRFNLGNPEGHKLPDIDIENDKTKGFIRSPPIYHLKLTKRSFLG